MKLLSWFFLSFLMMLIVVSPASARDMAVGFSPYTESHAAERQVRSVLLFLSETLEPGESCLVFDAYRIQSLGVFVVPNKSAYRHPKAKIQVNRQVVSAMLQFAHAARKPQGGSEPSIIGAIRMPQALEFIGTNYPTTEDSDVLLFGSPLYDDPKDKLFTMRQNRIPGDGHLSKSRSATPYGIKGQPSLLTKRRVHLWFPDVVWKQGDHHEYFLKRFWTLFIEGQGGTLSTFTHDLPTMFQRVKTKAPASKHDYKVEATEKLEMIILRPPVVKHQTSIYEQPLSSVPIPLSMLRQASNVEVGITWECGACDLDLYGQHGSEHRALSYLNTQTPGGNYFKDWTSSPRATNGYETLVFHAAVDMKALLLAVNFYNGQSPGGVKGEIRISLNGQTYAKTFQVLAPQGNGGVGRDETLNARRPATAQWLVIDPLEVLGIRAS